MTEPEAFLRHHLDTLCAADPDARVTDVCFVGNHRLPNGRYRHTLSGTWWGTDFDQHLRLSVDTDDATPPGPLP